MLEHYSHIRSQAKQAAIRCLEEQASEPVLEETGHKIGHTPETKETVEAPNWLQTNGGPARIRPEGSGLGPTDQKTGRLYTPSSNF